MITEQQIKKAIEHKDKQIAYWRQYKVNAREKSKKAAGIADRNMAAINRHTDLWIARLTNKRSCTWHNLTAKAKMFVMKLKK